MTICLYNVILLIIVSTLIGKSDSFRLSPSSRHSRSVVCHASKMNAETAKPLTRDVTADLLRSLTLFDQNGDKKELGSLMGADKSVVIFLRHLGWPYCWSYAESWCEKIPQMRASNVAGPIFVSIGEGTVWCMYQSMTSSITNLSSKCHHSIVCDNVLLCRWPTKVILGEQSKDTSRFDASRWLLFRGI